MLRQSAKSNAVVTFAELRQVDIRYWGAHAPCIYRLSSSDFRCRRKSLLDLDSFWGARSVSLLCESAKQSSLYFSNVIIAPFAPNFFTLEEAFAQKDHNF